MTGRDNTDRGLQRWQRRVKVAYAIRDIAFAMWQVVLPGVALVTLGLASVYEQVRDPSFLTPAGAILVSLAGAKLWLDRSRSGPPTSGRS